MLDLLLRQWLCAFDGNAILRRPRFAGVSSDVIDSCIPRDVKHPRPKPSVVTVRLPVFPDSEEDILNQIVGNRPAAGQTSEEVVGNAMVRYNKRGQLVSIDVSHGL